MYCINPYDDEPIFCLFNQIGKDEENPLRPYVDGNDFARELLYMDGEGKKRIQIWINSEGGSVKDGLSICSAILKTKTKIDTLNVGIAYSMAAMILVMGRKREAYDYTSVMCHNPLNPDGTEDKGLEVLRKSLVTAMAGRSGQSEAEMEKIMNAETFYTADEAKKAGLIDEVLACNETNVPRSSKSDTAAIKTFGINYVAKLLPQNKYKMDKKAICALLGLDENVSDAVAFAKLAEFKAAAEAASKKAKKNDDGDEDEDEDEDNADNKKSKKKMKAAQEAADKFKAVAKEKINAQAKASNLTLEDKDVNEYVALSATPEGLTIVLNQITEKGKAVAKTAADAVIAKAKTDIVAKLTERGIKADDKQIDRYVAMAGTTTEGLKNVIETIEAIPSKKVAPVMKQFDKDAVDKIGIPLIEAAGTDKDGNPIAGDTTKMVSAINSFDIHQWKNRKRG